MYYTMGPYEENQKLLTQMKPWLIIEASNYQAYLKYASQFIYLIEPFTLESITVCPHRLITTRVIMALSRLCKHAT